MRINRFELLSNRNGVVLYKMRQAGLFNEQRVAEWFVSIQPAWHMASKSAKGVGSFTARIFAFGPFVWGKFTY